MISEKKQYSFEDFSRWFKVSGLPKEQKNLNIERMIHRLVVGDIIQHEDEKKIYSLTQNTPIKAVELVNLGKIRFGLMHHYEKKLLSDQCIFYFTSVFGPSDFYHNLQDLIGENLFQIKFWKTIGNPYGQLISYIRAEEYYSKVVQSKVKIRPCYSEFETIDIQSEMKKNAYFKTFKNYIPLKNHFKKCFDKQCRTCGKNVYNLVLVYVEKIKAEVKARKEYLVLMDYVRKFPHKKIVNYREDKNVFYKKIDMD